MNSSKNDAGEVSLNAYVVKIKENGMRNILLLQTKNPAHCVTQYDKKKPLAYKIDDYKKSGIDKHDQRMGSYTAKFKTRKWTLIALSYVLEADHINSKAVYEPDNTKPHIRINWEKWQRNDKEEHPLKMMIPQEGAKRVLLYLMKTGTNINIPSAK